MALPANNLKMRVAVHPLPYPHSFAGVPVGQAGLAEHRMLEEDRVRVVGLDLDRRTDQPLLNAARRLQDRELVAEKALLIVVRHARMVAGEVDAGYQILTAGPGNPQELGRALGRAPEV